MPPFHSADQLMQMLYPALCRCIRKPGLSQNSGKVMTYSAIIRSIWGVMDDGSVKKLQVNMANIRKKLGCKPGENRYIINELGVGYRMQDPQD